MAAPTVDQTSSASQEEVFRAIDAYPWAEDTEFQAGLAAILGPNTDPQQVQRLTLRARCFYFSRKNDNVPIDFPSYVTWHFNQASSIAANGNGQEGHDALSPTHPTVSQMRPTESSIQQVLNETSAPPSEDAIEDISTRQTGQDAAPPYPMTFNQIVELISTGAPIPGIREIPDTLLEGQSTESTKERRRKPWEKDS